MGGNPNLNPNHNRQRLGNIVNRVFESAGPEGKVRGTPQQIIEKYQALARDAQLSGDRVAAESFLQFAEHYTRLLGEAQAAQAEARQAFEREDGQPRDGGREGGRDGGREGGPREEARRGEDGGERARFDGGQPARKPEPAFASGFATIETDDGERGALIETPESAAAAADAVEAEPRPQGGVNGAHHSAGEAGAGDAAAGAAAEPEAKPAAKRARPRRRAPKAEGEAPAAAVE